MNKAAEDFFANLPNEEKAEGEQFDMFKEDGATEKPAQEPEQQKEGEHIEERKKPLRSERRAEKQTNYLQERLQEEREARIRLEEQVKALATQTKVEVDPDIKRLLTETKDPEEATRIFESLIERAERRASERAEENYRKLQESGDKEVNDMANEINNRLEAIEDRYGVDLTDDSDTRNAFLDFVNSIAPEDSDELPNMNTAWKLFQQTRTAPPSQTERKAAISSRGMTRSVQPIPDGKNVKSVNFDAINRGNWWDKVVGRK